MGRFNQVTPQAKGVTGARVPNEHHLEKDRKKNEIRAYAAGLLFKVQGRLLVSLPPVVNHWFSCYLRPRVSDLTVQPGL